MRRILLTGSSGFVGGHIAAAFGRSTATTVTPFDIAAGEAGRHDVRQPLDRLLQAEQIDTVIHAAFVLGPTHDRQRMFDVNVNGTRNVAAACARNGVRQLVHLSSACVYGFHPNGPAEYTEQIHARPNEAFAYGHQKWQIESELGSLASGSEGVIVTILRPSTILSAGANNAFARYLTGRIVPVPYPSAPMQFTHAEDLANVVRCVVERRLAGTYNVGAAGAVTIAEAAAILRRPILPVPYFALRAMAALTWQLRLPGISIADGASCEMLRHPWVVSSAKLWQATGYEFRHTSLGALQDFAATAR